jgi:hypothetical protein
VPPPDIPFTYPGVSPLTFLEATVATNNLGGMCGKRCEQANYDTSTGTCGYVDTGSNACSSDDPQQLYYANLGMTDSGITVDLRVTNMTSYLPWNADASGVNGEWGNINVIGNEPVFLEFCFIDAGTGEPTELQEFMFTWVDMDDAASGYNEQISFNATEIDSYTLISDSSEVQVTEATLDNGQSLVNFRSSQLGIGKDNPATFDDLYTTSPASAGIQEVQQARTFTTTFTDRSCFLVVLGVVWPGFSRKVDFPSELGMDYPSGTGRNIQFAVSGNVIASPFPPPPPRQR